MSYNTILDGYFSTYMISIGIPVLLLASYYLFFRRFIRKGKEYTFTERTVSIGVSFVLIMIPAFVNPLYWGYGPPEAIDDIRFDGDKLLVVDHIMTMGSRTDEGDPCSRIHVLDPNTGQKLNRFSVGVGADLTGAHGDTVTVTLYNEAKLFSLTDGSEYALYDKTTLPKYFPELSSGISSYMWGDGFTVMEITALDGSNWNLYLETGKLYPDDKEHRREYKPTGKLYLHDREVRKDESYGNTVIELDGQNGNQHQLYITDGQDSILNKNLVFLDGTPVAVDQKNSCFVILHYETLLRREFALTCVSLDGQQVLWEIHQAQFNSEFKFDEYVTPHTGYNEQSNTLCFNIGTDLYCVDMKNGAVLWQTSL